MTAPGASRAARSSCRPSTSSSSSPKASSWLPWPCSASPTRPSACAAASARGRTRRQPFPPDHEPKGENHGSDPSRARRKARPDGRDREGPFRLRPQLPPAARQGPARHGVQQEALRGSARPRSEEHTSELQSRQYLVCRLLLEKKI